MFGTLRRTTFAATASAVAITLCLALTSCGNVLTSNNFSFTAVSPSGQAVPKIRVSIFDSAMGSSAEWADQSMGTATSSAPYQTSFETSSTKMIGDGSSGATVRAGIALPDVAPKGYFALSLLPVDGQTATLDAPFIGYYGYNVTTDGPVAPLKLTVVSTEGSRPWQLAITANLSSTTASIPT